MNEKSENKFMGFVNKNSKKIIIALVIVAALGLAAIGGLWWAFRNYDPNILAEVGSVKITRQDLNTRIYATNFAGSPENPTSISDSEKDKLLQELVKEEIVKREAVKNNITVSDEEIDAEIKDRDIKYSDFTSAQKDLARKSAKYAITEKKLKDVMLSSRSGRYLLFRFDKYYNLYSDLKITGAGDTALIQKQKTYAKQLADSVYAKLANKEITFAQAKGIMWDDPEIGYEAYKALNPNISGVFTEEEYDLGTGVMNDAQNNLKSEADKLKANEISRPFVYENLMNTGDNGKYKEQAYAIMEVQTVKGGYVTTSFEAWLDQQLAKSDVKVNYFTTKKISFVEVFAAQKAYAGATRTCYPNGSEQTGIYIWHQVKNAVGSTSAFYNVNGQVESGATAATIDRFNASCVEVGQGKSSAPMLSWRSKSVGALGNFSGIFIGDYETGVHDAYLHNCAISNFGYYRINSIPTIVNTNGGSWRYVARGGIGAITTAGGIPVATNTIVGNPMAWKSTYDVDNDGRLESANGTSIDFYLRYEPVYVPTDNRTLTLNVTGGTVTATPPAPTPAASTTTTMTQTYVNGTVVAVSAVNAAGYGTTPTWSGDCSAFGANLSGSVTVNANKTCNVSFAALTGSGPALTCPPSPQTGLAPLVVKVEPSISNPASGVTYTYNYDMGDGTTLANRGTPVYYTYSTAGSYTITVTSNPATGVSNTPCSAVVTVTNPTGSDGGEVNPGNN